jgi:predicted DNA-binding protein with PD1-like motif
MRAELLGEQGFRTYLLVFETGDEAVTGLLKFAREYGVAGAHFTAVGSFERATVGYFNVEKKEYERLEIDEQVEVVSLVGNLALYDGGPRVHAHVVVGKRDGTAHGGHLLEGRVRPTLELFLTDTGRTIRRRLDEATNLPLIDLATDADAGGE